MTGFWPLNHKREVVVEIVRPHTRREWFGCPDCWAKIKPGPAARLVADYDPTGLQGREGDS